MYPLVRRSRLSVRRAAGKRLWQRWWHVFGKRQTALCCWTANHCASGRFRRCAERSVLCRKIRIFSAKRSAAISVSGFRKWMTRAFARPRKSQISMATCRSSRKNTRRWSANAASRFPVDGKPLREWPLSTLRRAIGFVPQDTYLFGETVGGNISFGLSEVDDARIREAAEIANLDGDVQEFAEKYETMVGERGITLSGGQKQRTAIARAVARDPRILILDDSLSSVDTQTEERILQRLRGVMDGRTTILISHRTSTVKDADQIVVLVDGGISECGTHDELLSRGGYYADLYQKQLLEEELERA